MKDLTKEIEALPGMWKNEVYDMMERCMKLRAETDKLTHKDILKDANHDIMVLQAKIIMFQYCIITLQDVLMGKLAIET